MHTEKNYYVELKNKYEELKKNPKVTDDMEYYFISAQILKFYGYETRKNVHISFALRCTADMAFKRVLIGNLRHFRFPNSVRGRTFENLYKEVLDYTPQKVKGDIRELKEIFFVGGCTLDFII